LSGFLHTIFKERPLLTELDGTIHTSKGSTFTRLLQAYRFHPARLREVSTRQDGVELFFTSSDFPRDSFTSRSASYDEKVIVWDVNNFSLMENIIVKGYVSDLAFSADGFYLKTNNGSFKLKSAVGVSYDENDCFLRLAIRRHWISRHRHKTIWLPQELRRHNYAASVCGPFMALGH
jgi:WD40 repeat protein